MKDDNEQIFNPNKRKTFEIHKIFNSPRENYLWKIKSVDSLLGKKNKMKDILALGTVQC